MWISWVRSHSLRLADDVRTTRRSGVGSLMSALGCWRLGIKSTSRNVCKDWGTVACYFSIFYISACIALYLLIYLSILPKK